MKPAMDFLSIIEHAGKPRKNRLTLVRDPGFGLQMLRVHLETAAPFIDYAKARNITPRLFPEAGVADPRTGAGCQPRPQHCA